VSRRQALIWDAEDLFTLPMSIQLVRHWEAKGRFQVNAARLLRKGNRCLMQPASEIAEHHRPRLGWRYSRFTAIAEWVLLVALLAIFVKNGFLPGWRTLISDFPDFHLAASIYHRGIPLDRVYEWLWFQRQKDYLGGIEQLVEFIPNPPMCVLPVLPLSALAPLAAKRVWLVMNIGFLLLALELLRRVTKLNWRRLGLVSLLCVVPLRDNFALGQYYALILLLICAAYYLSCSGRRLTSGLLLSVAASLKLFPGLFLILFVWKRDWRSAAGMILGTTVLTLISIAMFGLEVHRVLLIEVLPRALRGDLVGPYYLGWNSFTALWHYLFLFEPELNPAPLLASPVVYALTQAMTVTALLFAFLLSTRDDGVKSKKAFEWSVLVLLSLLLSSMPGSYHYCLLVFAGGVCMDELLKAQDKRKALLFILLLLITCAPVPGRIGKFFLSRLVGGLALYVLLLQAIAIDKRLRIERRWLVAAVFVGAALTIFNLNSLKNRAQDFRRRVSNPSIGYSASNPVVIGDRVIFTEMRGGKYAAMSLQRLGVREIPIAGDVLSVGGTKLGNFAYFEQVTRESSITQFPLASSDPIPQHVAEGEQPRVSPDGRWLAFIREKDGRTTVWLSELGSQGTARLIINGVPNVLDICVTSNGDLIAAAGTASEPQLVTVRRSTGAIEPLSGIAGPARYPSISPNGRRLAFSRRSWGSWQLVVRELATGTERQLTNASCNATLPTWEDTHTLLYATDCGREFGLSALARVVLPD